MWLLDLSHCGINIPHEGVAAYTVPMDRSETASATLREILLYLWPYNQRYAYQYYPYLLSNVVGVMVTGILLPLALRQFIDAIVAAQERTPDLIGHLSIVLGFIALLSLLKVLSVVMSDQLITYMGPKAIRDIENDCFTVLHGLPLAYFAQAPVGSIVAKVKRFSNGYNMLDLHITRGLLESTVQLLGTIAVVALLSPLLSLAFFGWGVAYVAIVLFAVRWKMRLDVGKVRADSSSTGLLADGITNVLVVKTFARFPLEHARFRSATQYVADATRRSWIASTWINALQALLVGSASVLLLFLAFRLWMQGALSVGSIVLIHTYVFLVGTHFLQMGEQLKAIYRAAADCTEMMDIIRMKPAVIDPPRPCKPMIDQGAIHVASVTFGYHPSVPVFRDFSLTIPAGQKVGLVGHSGAGKSTLFALLLRFMDVQDGSVSIDGQDIRSLLQDDLRAHISYVPQEPLLFHRSIRDNIAYGNPEADDAAIQTAARKAHILESIEAMPLGFDTVVGERGVQLSGGERQRIAIARAMLKDAPILLLDEATSALDSVSERHIREAFDALVSGRTTVVIAHRLSTVQRLDRIVVLDHGRIVEDGTHEALLRHDGTYAELWRHQSAGLLGVKG